MKLIDSSELYIIYNMKKPFWLNVDVCRKCSSLFHRSNFKDSQLKTILAVQEARIKSGKIFCPKRAALISLLEVPEWCPFELEHLLMNGTKE